MRGPEHETALVETTEDIMLVELSTAPIALPPEPRKCDKKYHPSRKSKGDEARARKKERTDLEMVRRASLIDEQPTR